MLETCQTLENSTELLENSKHATQQNGRTRFERIFAMAGMEHIFDPFGRFFRSIGLSADYLRISEMKEKELLYLLLGVNLLPVFPDRAAKRESVICPSNTKN